MLKSSYISTASLPASRPNGKGKPRQYSKLDKPIEDLQNFIKDLNGPSWSPPTDSAAIHRELSQLLGQAKAAVLDGTPKTTTATPSTQQCVDLPSLLLIVVTDTDASHSQSPYFEARFVEIKLLPRCGAHVCSLQ